MKIGTIEAIISVSTREIKRRITNEVNDETAIGETTSRMVEKGFSVKAEMRQQEAR